MAARDSPPIPGRLFFSLFSKNQLVLNTVTSLLFTLFSFILFLTPQLFAFTVVIDPGHGGIDHGASRGTFVEDKIVYDIAEKIQNIFKDNSEIQVLLTRTLGKGLSLEDRVRFAKEKKADLFLSLHANSSTSTQVSGMEYYFSAKQPTSVLLRSSTASIQQSITDIIKKDLIEFGKTKKSLDFSKKIQNQAAVFLQSNKFKNQDSATSKIRRAPFYVIDNTEMPAVLVEVGFISNQREARKLITPSYQQELAHALSAAIQDYKAQLLL